MSNINTAAVFVEYRISMFYLLTFIYVFSARRYHWIKTITILETILVQGSCLVIQKERSFKGLFIGITSAAYVLMGNVGWSMAYIYSDNWIFIFAVQILTHTILLGILIVSIRDMFLRQLVYVNKGWKLLCLVPSLFYVLTYALTE